MSKERKTSNIPIPDWARFGIVIASQDAVACVPEHSGRVLCPYGKEGVRVIAGQERVGITQVRECTAGTMGGEYEE